MWARACVTALGRRWRVRHDDPKLTPYSPGVTRLRAAVQLARTREGLLRVLETTVADRYAVQLAKGEIRLRRRRD